jgi:hypothetical protein
MFARLPAPVAHRLIGQDDAACGHQLFNVTVTEAETKIEPNTVADNLRRKPMALIWMGWGVDSYSQYGILDEGGAKQGLTAAEQFSSLAA